MSTIDPPEELLSAYLDGEATPEERVLVEQQLEDSEEWRTVLEEVRSTRALLLGLQEREAPTGFWDTVLDPDIAPPVDLDAQRKKRHAKRAITWLAGAAAAAAVVAVVLIPQEAKVKPAVATMVNRHAVRSSVTAEPVSELAPVAQPVKLGP